MNYSKEEVMQYVAEEDVKFIRLAFSDVFVPVVLFIIKCYVSFHMLHSFRL